jgi:hypothetical protein
VLLTTYLVAYRLLADRHAEELFAAISTNVDNLRHRPLIALFGSPLVIVARDVSLLNILLVNGLGVVGCLGWLEHRYTAARAFGTYFAGHIGGTLVSALVVGWAVGAGHYPEALRHGIDYGVSYGAIAAIGALAPLVGKWLRIPWAVITILYPFTAADWYGRLPDPTTVGHLAAGSIGLGIGVVLARRARLSDRPQENPAPGAKGSHGG